MGDRDVALVTPSYGLDRERCRLLCDSIDERVSGHSAHYVLVADHDFDAFRSLAGPRREIVRESDILPERLWCLPTPGGRRAWLSTFAWPLRGWHVQQLRRIALARHISHDALLYCDSDMAFVRPYDTASLWRGDRLRLYRKPGGINSKLAGGGAEHMAWTRHAHALNGLAEPEFPANDYINNLVSWSRTTTIAMLDRIESVHERPWMKAVTRQRAFSECQIYGAYADGYLGGEGTWIDETGLCRTRWYGGSMGVEALEEFVSEAEAEQVAVGIQSFTGTDPATLRRVLGL